jgi:hypothetical protein
LSSSARVSARAARRDSPLCTTSVSLIWSPMVSTGFRLVIGSWKIIPMSRPRSRRNSSCGRPIRSRPSNSTLPEISAVGSRPRMAWVSTLFPEPDSPAMPNSSPWRIEKETSRTACTVPSSVGISTVRPSTCRMGMAKPRGSGTRGAAPAGRPAQGFGISDPARCWSSRLRRPARRCDSSAPPRHDSAGSCWQSAAPPAHPPSPSRRPDPRALRFLPAWWR